MTFSKLTNCYLDWERTNALAAYGIISGSWKKLVVSSEMNSFSMTSVIFTTNARGGGVQEREIMAITGHTSRSTFGRYPTVDGNDLRKAIQRTGDVFRKC